MDSELLTAARAWFDAGYAVIPSHPDGSKRPFGPWKSYQTKPPTWEEIEGWLSTGDYTGIGVICGKSSGNAELIEIEGPGDEAVQRLNKVLGVAGDAGLVELVATVARGCVEQSAGGGLHMFVRVSDGPAKPNTKLAMQGTGTERHVIAETRGEGGFVIVAPTPARKGHKEGSSYLFLQGSSPSGTPTVTASERDEIHNLLIYALDEYDPTTPAAPPVTGSPVAPQAVDGTFGDYRERVTWESILAPQGWTYLYADNEGRSYWTRPGKDPKEGASATTVEDGPMYVFSTSTTLPSGQGMSKEYVYAHLHHSGDLKAASAALRGEGYGPAAVSELPPWEAQIDPDASPEEREEAETSWVAENLPRVDWNELWAEEHQEDWIVEPLLAARRLVALYSAPKVGKSLLMLEIAAAVAAGRPMFGYEAKAPRRTLYVDFENDPRADIRERLTNMGYGPDDLDNLVLLSFPTIAKFDTERGSMELMAAVSHYRTEIVVIDTVSRAVAGEENENDTWLNFYKHTGLKMKQAGVALMRLDHSGKDESKGQRGGSAKSGDVDAVWRMSKSGEDVFDLVCEAQRFPISETTLTIRRVEDPVLRHVVEGDGPQAKRDDLLAAMAEKGVPKDLEMPLRDLRPYIRKTFHVTFKNSSLTAELWDRYRFSASSWVPKTLPEAGQNV